MSDELPDAIPQPTPRYAWLTTVTPLSKYVAMSLFVALPFVGFWVGVRYAEAPHVQQTGYGTNTAASSSTTLDTAIVATPEPSAAHIDDAIEALRSNETAVPHIRAWFVVQPGPDRIADFGTVPQSEVFLVRTASSSTQSEARHSVGVYDGTCTVGDSRFAADAFITEAVSQVLCWYAGGGYELVLSETATDRGTTTYTVLARLIYECGAEVECDGRGEVHTVYSVSDTE